MPRQLHGPLERLTADVTVFSLECQVRAFDVVAQRRRVAQFGRTDVTAEGSRGLAALSAGSGLLAGLLEQRLAEVLDSPAVATQRPSTTTS